MQRYFNVMTVCVFWNSFGLRSCICIVFGAFNNRIEGQRCPCWLREIVHAVVCGLSSDAVCAGRPSGPFSSEAAQICLRSIYTHANRG